MNANLPIPIAQLEPGADRSGHVQGVVTLIWPYSSSKKVFSLLLVDPDFRLRRNKGQVRITFKGSCAKSLAKAGIVSGNELQVKLAGCKWLQEDPNSSTVRTPGSTVGWELLYDRQLSLQILQDGVAARTVDIEYAPGSQENEAANELLDPQTPVQSRFASSPPSSVRSFESWSTPAFLKKRTLEQALAPSSYDVFADEGALADEPAPKRMKFGRASQQWRFVDDDVSDGEQQPLSTDTATSLLLQEARDDHEADVAETPERQHDHETQTEQLSQVPESALSRIPEMDSSQAPGSAPDVNLTEAANDGFGELQMTDAELALLETEGVDTLVESLDSYLGTQDGIVETQNQLWTQRPANHMPPSEVRSGNVSYVTVPQASEVEETMLPLKANATTTPGAAFAENDGNQESYVSSVVETGSERNDDKSIDELFEENESELVINTQPVVDIQQAEIDDDDESQSEGYEEEMEASAEDENENGEDEDEDEAEAEAEDYYEDEEIRNRENQERIMDSSDDDDNDTESSVVRDGADESQSPADAGPPMQAMTNSVTRSEAQDTTTSGPMEVIELSSEEESDGEESVAPGVDETVGRSAQRSEGYPVERVEEDQGDYDEDEDAEEEEEEFYDEDEEGDEAGEAGRQTYLEEVLEEADEGDDYVMEDDRDKAVEKVNEDAQDNEVIGEHVSQPPSTNQLVNKIAFPEMNSVPSRDHAGQSQGTLSFGSTLDNTEFGITTFQQANSASAELLEASPIANAQSHEEHPVSLETEQQQAKEQPLTTDDTSLPEIEEVSLIPETAPPNIPPNGPSDSVAESQPVTLEDEHDEVMEVDEGPTGQEQAEVEQSQTFRQQSPARSYDMADEMESVSLEIPLASLDPSNEQKRSHSSFSDPEVVTEHVEAPLDPTFEQAEPQAISISHDDERDEDSQDHEAPDSRHQSSPSPPALRRSTRKRRHQSINAESLQLNERSSQSQQKSVPENTVRQQDMSARENVAESATALEPDTDLSFMSEATEVEIQAVRSEGVSPLKRSARRSKRGQQGTISAVSSAPASTAVGQVDGADSSTSSMVTRTRRPKAKTQVIVTSTDKQEASDAQEDGTARTPVDEAPADKQQDVDDQSSDVDQVSQQLLQEAQTAHDQEELLPPISKGVRTKNAYLSPLSNLPQHHRQKVDAMSIVVGTTKPERAQTGPRDWHLTLYVTDGSMQDATQTLRTVQIFRPTKSALPLAAAADNVILLYQFQCKTLNRRPMLISTASSGWAVFDDEGTVKTSGPPMEYGEEESGLSQQLAHWWSRVPGDKKMQLRTNFVQSRDAAKEAARRKSGRRSIVKPGALAHELRDGTIYPYTDTPLVSDE